MVFEFKIYGAFGGWKNNGDSMLRPWDLINVGGILKLEENSKIVLLYA